MSDKSKEAKAEIVPSFRLIKPEPGGNAKLTIGRVEAICLHLYNGWFITDACRAEGITPKTYHNWIERGQTDPEGVYAEATELFEQARSMADGEDIEYIRAGKANWQSRAWRLERMRPEQYSLVNRVSSTVNATHKLIIQWGNVAIEDSNDEDDSQDYITATT